MNKKLKICAMIFVLVSHISSFGMFTAYTLPKQWAFRSKNVLQSPAIRSSIGTCMREERNNEYMATKLIELPRKSSILLFPKDLIFFYGVHKELRLTCKHMEELIVPSNLAKMRMLCHNSYNMKPWSSFSHIDFKAENNLWDVFAFSAAINDIKNYEILYKKLDGSMPQIMYPNYRDMIERQIFNDREETVRALLKKDPFGFNNLDRGSCLFEDINSAFRQRRSYLHSNHNHGVDQDKYMKILRECGCKSLLEIGSQEEFVFA